MLMHTNIQIFMLLFYFLHLKAKSNTFKMWNPYCGKTQIFVLQNNSIPDLMIPSIFLTTQLHHSFLLGEAAGGCCSGEHCPTSMNRCNPSEGLELLFKRVPFCRSRSLRQDKTLLHVFNVLQPMGVFRIATNRLTCVFVPLSTTKQDRCRLWIYTLVKFVYWMA